MTVDDLPAPVRGEKKEGKGIRSLRPWKVIPVKETVLDCIGFRRGLRARPMRGVTPAPMVGCVAMGGMQHFTVVKDNATLFDLGQCFFR